MVILFLNVIANNSFFCMTCNFKVKSTCECTVTWYFHDEERSALLFSLHLYLLHFGAQIHLPHRQIQEYQHKYATISFIHFFCIRSTS